MCNTKGVPEDNVCVLNVFVSVLLNPLGQAARWVASSLWDVAAGGMELIILV